MYVCMFVCIVCMYVCMHCMYVCLYVYKFLLVAKNQFESIVRKEARAIAGQLQHRAGPG